MKFQKTSERESHQPKIHQAEMRKKREQNKLPTIKKGLTPQKHTLDSDIQMGAVCCLSIRSVNLLYHWFSAVILAKVVVAVKT